MWNPLCAQLLEETIFETTTPIASPDGVESTTEVWNPQSAQLSEQIDFAISLPQANPNAVDVQQAIISIPDEDPDQGAPIPSPQPSIMDEIMGPEYDGAAEEEKDIDRIVAMAGNWAAQYAAGVKDNDYQQHIDSGHVIPLPAGHPPCDACHKAKIQDKPAFNFAKAHCTNLA